MLKSFKVIHAVCLSLSFAAAGSALANNNCQHYFELSLTNVDYETLPPKYSYSPWLPESLLRATDQGSKSEQSFAYGSLLKSTAERLNEVGTRYIVETSFDTGPSSFSLRIIPGPESPLSQLATQLRAHGLHLHLSSCASTGNCSQMTLDKTFEVRLPLEAADLSEAEVNNVFKAILTAYDWQEERILRHTFHSPKTSLRHTSLAHPGIDVRYALAAYTQKVRQRVRKQRRFLNKDLNPSLNAEISLLHYVSTALEQLKLKPDDLDLHQDFAERLKIYLEATGLPSEVRVNPSGESYDLILIPTQPNAWKKIYGKTISLPDHPVLTQPQFPELLALANELGEHGKSLAFTTRAWIDNAHHWTLVPSNTSRKAAPKPSVSATEESAAAETQKPAIQFTNESLFYLPTREVLRERPLPLTPILARATIAAEPAKVWGISEGLPKQLSELNYEVFPAMKNSLAMLEHGQTELRNLLALRHTFLPPDFHAIVEQLGADLANVAKVQIIEIKKLKSVVSEIRNPRWVRVEAHPSSVEGDMFSDLKFPVMFHIKNHSGKSITLIVQDSAFKSLLQGLSENEIDQAARYYLTQEIARIDRLTVDVSESIEASLKLLIEAKAIQNKIPEAVPGPYPGTSDHLLLHHARRQKPAPEIHFHSSDYASGAGVFLLKSFTSARSVESQSYANLLGRFQEDFYKGKETLSQVYAFLKPHLQSGSAIMPNTFDINIPGWFAVLEAQAPYEPKLVADILIDMLPHHSTETAIMRNVELLLRGPLTQEQKDQIDRVMAEKTEY